MNILDWRICSCLNLLLSQHSVMMKVPSDLTCGQGVCRSLFMWDSHTNTHTQWLTEGSADVQAKQKLQNRHDAQKQNKVFVLYKVWMCVCISDEGARAADDPSVSRHTSLKSSSLLCCFLRSIFFTATCLPLCFSLAMHTIPVEPSPILIKLSRYSRGSPDGKHTQNADETLQDAEAYILFVMFTGGRYMRAVPSSKLTKAALNGLNADRMNASFHI